MIYVSFMAILPEGISLIEEYMGHEKGHNIALIAFFWWYDNYSFIRKTSSSIWR